MSTHLNLFEAVTELEESAVQGGQTNFFVKTNSLNANIQLTGTGGLFAPAFPFGNLITEVLRATFGRTVYLAPPGASAPANGIGFYFSYINDDPYDILGLNGKITPGLTPFG